MKEGITLKIKIIDMPMGTGKTIGVINYMNSHPEKRYMFITPFLDEVQRIKLNCPSLEFEEPSEQYSKLNSLKKLIAEDKNIVSTHALFRIYNYLHHKVDSKVAEAMWTTFLGTNGRNKDKLQPRDYKTNTFVSCNARATNKFSNKMNLVYAVNMYINPYVSRYLQTNQVDIDGDKYALVQMLQWIWRSRIRNGYDINIYIPSSRMRRLLIQWMGN